MIRKWLIILVFALVLCGTLPAQERQDVSFKNTVIGKVTLLGGGFSYERNLNRFFSIGLDASIAWMPFINNWGVDAFVRAYPFGGTFFAEVGFGYGEAQIDLFEIVGVRNAGFRINPGFGWKIGLGRTQRFIIQPSISLPVTIGERTDFLGTIEEKEGVGYVLGVTLALGFGFAF